MTGAFELDISGDGAAIRIVARGELDVVGARNLTLVLDAAPAVITLDLAGVTFIDSNGLRSILVAHREGKQITLCDPSDAVAKILEIAGVDDVLRVVSSA